MAKKQFTENQWRITVTVLLIELNALSRFHLCTVFPGGTINMREI
jgi:hypothetical protein